jgi:hypothetical protein
MRIFIVLLALATMAFGGHTQAGPLGGKPKEIVRTVTPEVYDVSIHLKGGEVVHILKVGMTPFGIKHRLSFNSLDKTLVVRPVDKGEVKVIKTADIEKIEMVPVRDKPEVNPAPQTVPAPTPVTYDGNWSNGYWKHEYDKNKEVYKRFEKDCKCNPCKCVDCKCAD